MSRLPAILVLLCIPVVYAAAPTLQTPSPVIHLQDNLDEADSLGWCIDTLGRGFSEQLQVHSCKPRGGDVQFEFVESTAQIRSVEFPDKCMTLIDVTDKSVPFGLLDCDDSVNTQKYSYESGPQEIRLFDQPDWCVAAGPGSRSAGPYMSRDLVVLPCVDIEPEFKRWVIVE